MGIRFSKSIKLGKYLRLNISRYGISASIGKKGASISIGNRGTFLNLSPAAVGVNGTGISYRKKLTDALGKKKKKTSKSRKKVQHTYIPAEEIKETKQEVQETENQVSVQENVIQEYEQDLLSRTYIHKYADNVMSKESFQEYVDALESASSKELYELSIAGDEDTIENLVASFMNNLHIAYEARVNYELEDNVLYVDLDLPEIEELEKEYPVISRDKIVYKRKTSAALREEYADTVLSIGVFLAANFFNLSSYIDTVVMSGFNTVRDAKGDLIDQYLYSVKYDRKIFEKTDLDQLEDLYSFILQFENRINLSVNHVFKAIQPYEMESVSQMNALIDDAILGLKELGYKMADIKGILPQLNECQYESSSDYLKEALKLLNERK